MSEKQNGSVTPKRNDILLSEARYETRDMVVICFEDEVEREREREREREGCTITQSSGRWGVEKTIAWEKEVGKASI
jgi:hypothetical protein